MPKFLQYQDLLGGTEKKKREVELELKLEKSEEEKSVSLEINFIEKQTLMKIKQAKKSQEKDGER